MAVKFGVIFISDKAKQLRSILERKKEYIRIALLPIYNWKLFNVR